MDFVNDETISKLMRLGSRQGSPGTMMIRSRILVIEYMTYLAHWYPLSDLNVFDSGPASDQDADPAESAKLWPSDCSRLYRLGYSLPTISQGPQFRVRHSNDRFGSFYLMPFGALSSCEGSIISSDIVIDSRSVLIAVLTRDGRVVVFHSIDDEYFIELNHKIKFDDFSKIRFHPSTRSLFIYNHKTTRIMRIDFGDQNLYKFTEINSNRLHLSSNCPIHESANLEIIDKGTIRISGDPAHAQGLVGLGDEERMFWPESENSFEICDFYENLILINCSNYFRIIETENRQNPIFISNKNYKINFINSNFLISLNSRNSLEIFEINRISLISLIPVSLFPDDSSCDNLIFDLVDETQESRSEDNVVEENIFNEVINYEFCSKNENEIFILILKSGRIEVVLVDIENQFFRILEILKINFQIPSISFNFNKLFNNYEYAILPITADHPLVLSPSVPSVPPGLRLRTVISDEYIFSLLESNVVKIQSRIDPTDLFTVPLPDGLESGRVRRFEFHEIFKFNLIFILIENFILIRIRDFSKFNENFKFVQIPDNYEFFNKFDSRFYSLTAGFDLDKNLLELFQSSSPFSPTDPVSVYYESLWSPFSVNRDLLPPGTDRFVFPSEDLERAMDALARRFLISFHSPAVGVSSEDFLHAALSDSQSLIIQETLPSTVLVGWEEVRRTGIGFWVGLNESSVRAISESILKKNLSEYMKTKDTDILDRRFALWAAVLGKQQFLVTLYRQHGSSCASPGHTRVAQFLASDFSIPENKSKGIKNAFELLRQKRFEMSITVFLLCGAVQEAVDVCCRQLDDVQLGLFILKVLRTGIGVNSDQIDAITENVWQSRILFESDEFLRMIHSNKNDKNVLIEIIQQNKIILIPELMNKMEINQTDFGLSLAGNLLKRRLPHLGRKFLTESDNPQLRASIESAIECLSLK
jgi:hypothetical protein